jgi:ABC-type uncharacterized transport system auxiliary subunit
MRRRAWLAAAALLLGCAGGPAPRDHYYRIETAAPAPLPAPVFPGTVEVDRFRSDALTGGVRIVQRESPGAVELEPYAYHQWADPPTIQLQNRLVGFLREAKAAPLVVTPELRARADYTLLGRIAQLEHQTGGGAPRAVVELELAVLRESDRALLLQKVYREEQPAAGGSVAQAVDAANAAVSAIFNRFLADAQAQVSQTQVPQ